MTKTPLSLALAAALMAAAPATAVIVVAAPAQAASHNEANQARDRQAILAMAGDYRVRFDMRETVPFVHGYTPLEPKQSGGYESVRVVEDSPGKIILVVEHEGKPMVIKHWRQDWVYEPRTVLTYEKSNRWVLSPISDTERAGAWSQTVWQTDDSPRYGGVGRWEYDNGVTRWESGETLRPLARRDAVKKPVYGWYVGVNRHALTPDGWVHEQDNAKVGLKDGKAQTFVHEVVLNTYDKNATYDIKAADTYWNATKTYWAAVRVAWDDAIAKDRGVAVTEEAENGSVTGPKLMGLAEAIAVGTKDQRAAIAEARSLIAGAERTRPLASLK